MGFSRRRVDSKGRSRYVGLYRDIRGRQRSAGSFSNKKDADRAWQHAEVKLAEGRVGDPRRGRQTFERYVRDEWLPNHVMELRTRENYVLYLERVILPTFGPMRMIEILPYHVREWVVRFQKGTVELAPRRKGQRAAIKNSAAVIEYCMVILSAIFTTALNDQVIYLHPCKGVKTPAVAKKVRQIAISDSADRVRPRLRVVPDPADLGLTAPNDKGRRHAHGTTTAYVAGRCRCQHCRDAFAIYRAERRANGKDEPRQPRTVTTDGHIPRSWFRENIWVPALAAAELDRGVRVYDLRHAHASWLLAGGADLQAVKDRLGHGSIVTTQKYLHSLPEADDAAVDAFTKIRRRSG